MTASGSAAPVAWLVVAALLSVGLLVWGLYALRRKRLLEDVPTSKVKGVFMGLNEVKGRVRCDHPMVSYLAEHTCVYYSFDVSERWSRTVTYTDSKGRTQTRHESGWTTVASDEKRVSFDLEDDTGALRVRPRGAEIIADRVLHATCTPGDPLYYGKGPGGAVGNSDHVRRFTEHAIPLDAHAYVIGPARLRDDVVAPEIARERDAEIFLVSTRSEEKLTGRYGLTALLTLLFGTLAAAAFPIGLVLDRPATSAGALLRERAPLCFAFAGGYLAAIGLYYLLLVYNGLVSVRTRMRMARSMIDVQLRRRHDLIPRLVECVRGFARHEAATQERLAALRAGRDETAGQTEALRAVFAVAEAYPDLHADTTFRRLHAELVDTEDRIALARGFFNESVTVLNNRIEVMPDVLVARLGGFRRVRPLAAAGYERIAPRVDGTPEQ